MTFEEAVKACKKGKYVRAPWMGAGWKIFYSDLGKGLFYLNPVTGSNYAANLNDEQKSANWTIAS